MKYLLFLFPLIFVLSAIFAYRNYQYKVFQSREVEAPPGLRAASFDWVTGEIIYQPDTIMVFPPMERADSDTFEYNEINAIEEINQR